jgi:serine/threonine-protein kinase RsbT
MPPISQSGLSLVDVLDPLIGILTRYVSAPTAQSIINLARQRAGVGGVGSARLDRGQLREMLVPIERNLRLFLQDPVKIGECGAALRALASGRAEGAPPEALVIQIRAEDDIIRARVESRDLVARLGFTRTGVTRLVTAVSELARNIVQYAGEGQIELTSSSSPPGVEVVAKDRGPGIPNLEQIMAGQYKSRLGMGLGLRGVKRIADRFDIQTGAGRGTTVSFTLKVL